MRSRQKFVIRIATEIKAKENLDKLSQTENDKKLNDQTNITYPEELKC